MTDIQENACIVTIGGDELTDQQKTMIIKKMSHVFKEEWDKLGLEPKISDSPKKTTCRYCKSDDVSIIRDHGLLKYNEYYQDKKIDFEVFLCNVCNYEWSLLILL